MKSYAKSLRTPRIRELYTEWGLEAAVNRLLWRECTLQL